MPASTNRGISYPIPGDLVRTPSSDAKLAADMRVLALTADDAIRAEGSSLRAEVGTVSGQVDTLRGDTDTALDQQRADFEDALAGVVTAYDLAVSRGYVGTMDEWIASLEGPAGPEGPFGGTAVTDPQVASYVTGGGTETSTALSAAFRPRGDLIVSPTDHGAVGDGVTDDTAAFTAAITAMGDGATLWIPGGTYLITDTLTIAHHDAQVRGYGAILAGAEMEMLRIQGDRAVVSGITVDGAQLAWRGLHITGSGTRITGCDIHGFHSDTQGVSAVWAPTRGGVTIEGNRISDCYSLGNTTVGDGNGAARGISLNGTIAATAPSIIRGNTVTDILGEEGDAIHVIFGNSTPFQESLAVVEGNRVQGVTRRAIKVQAAGTVVRGNTYRETVQPTNPAAAIGVVSSPRILVEGNVLDSPGMKGISIGGVNALDNQGAIVRGNTIRGGAVSSGTEGALTLGCCEGGIVEDNVIIGYGYAMDITAGGQNIVRRNLVSGTGRTMEAIIVQANAPGCILDGNIFQGSTTNHAISVRAPDCVAVGNIVTGVVGLSLVRFVASATGGVSYGNTANGGSAVSTQDANNMFKGPDYRMSASSSGSIIWVNAIPTTSQSTTAHARGTIAFNRLITGVGQPLGWVCIADGTPGVWQPFGTT